MPRKGSERGQTTASGMSSPSMADLLRPLATASVADAMTRCLAPVYERFRCELQEVFDEANASPNGPMRRDLYILWKNARLRAIAGPGEPRPWGPEEQQALHRVCDAHFRVSQVIHEDNHRARLALRDYCAEHGVSMRDGWRELASVALLEIIDDRGESRRVGDPEMPFARLPIADPTDRKSVV